MRPTSLRPLAALAGAATRRRAVRDLRAQVAGRLVLTYDDGPGRRLQPLLLLCLRELGVRATFFVHGARAARDPGALRHLLLAGHEVAAHGFRHVDGWRSAAADETEDVERGVRTLVALAGGRPRWHRPPHGHATAATLDACRRLEVACTWWTHDGLDARGDLDPATLPSPAAIAARVVADGGGVLLLHAHDRADTPAGRDAEARTLAVTRAAVAAARAAGLHVGTLDELDERHDVETERADADGGRSEGVAPDRAAA